MAEQERIAIDSVRELATDSGYEVVGQDENSLRVRELDSGVVITSVLENDVLFNTVSCLTVDVQAVTGKVMLKMLDAENGISTSSFQLYRNGSEKFNITLNNFCKLLNMDADDEDDILSCYSFLVIDTFAARELLREVDNG
ncbi:MAG: hypothetical protein GY847_39970 [Proteobacteria bacterium]|nr:hypothetical protein [Pseudomonadota bacterium]